MALPSLLTYEQDDDYERGLEPTEKESPPP
jgi:hypothetical protein